MASSGFVAAHWFAGSMGRRCYFTCVVAMPGWKNRKIPVGLIVIQRVYEAERPELFFKALPHRVVGHQQNVYIRKDSTWNVPEPELALYINAAGAIQALYQWKRYELKKHRRGEPPVFAPGQGIRQKRRVRPPACMLPSNPFPLKQVYYMTIHRNEVKMYEGQFHP